jgi:hypothetical protein
MNYKHQYNCQKSSAKGRKIDWHFTYESWISWWGADIINRGRKTGQLVMARIGDKGAYHPDNVVKKTMNDNVREGNAHRCYDIVSQKLTGRVFRKDTLLKMKEAGKRGMTAEKNAKMLANRWPDKKQKETI